MLNHFPLHTIIIGAFLFRQKVTGFAVVEYYRNGRERSNWSLSFRRCDRWLQCICIAYCIACFFYASNLNFTNFSILDMPALTITSGSLLLIGPLAIIYLFGLLLCRKTDNSGGSVDAFGFVVFLGLMCTAIATVLFNQLVKLSGPLFTGTVAYLIPIVGVMWGVLDGEQLHIGHFAGMIAIIGGVYLANRRRS